MRNFINATLGCVFLIYPFAVYFFLEHTSTRIFALALLLILATRYYFIKNKLHQREKTALLIVAAGFFCWLFLMNNITALKLYPVLINLGLLLVFAMSLIHPPSMIERIARLQQPNLPAKAVRYTRNVTIIWCVFFVFNLTISALLALFATTKVWTLYVGFISYLLIFALLGLELLYRRLYIRPDEA